MLSQHRPCKRYKKENDESPDVQRPAACSTLKTSERATGPQTRLRFALSDQPNRQPDDELAPLADPLAACADRAVMKFHQPLDQRQSDPKSAP